MLVAGTKASSRLLPDGNAEDPCEVSGGSNGFCSVFTDGNCVYRCGVWFLRGKAAVTVDFKTVDLRTGRPRSQLYIIGRMYWIANQPRTTTFYLLWWKTYHIRKLGLE